MSEMFRSLIANCVIGGETMSQIGNSRVRNRLKFHFGGFDIEIVQRPEIIATPLDKIRGQQLYTTDLFISPVKPDRLESAKTLSRDLVWLLAFATLSDVWDFGNEYPAGSGQTHIQSSAGKIYYNRPVIEVHEGRRVREFLEKSLPGFRAAKASRKLEIAIDYFVTSQKGAQASEVQLILSFVLLENLKATFARSVGIPYRRGHFRKPDGNRYTFQELLERMFSSVGMSPNFQSIVRLRNEIIHSGVSEMAQQDQRHTYADVQDMAREYFLRLLGYTGYFYPYSEPNTPTKL